MLNRFVLVFAFVLAAITPCLAQDYPTRTVTLVVPYPPGGGVDAMARIVADKLSAALGQQVIVDNRGGGSGLVGTRAVIKKMARVEDGLELLVQGVERVKIEQIEATDTLLRAVASPMSKPSTASVKSLMKLRRRSSPSVKIWKPSSFWRVSTRRMCLSSRARSC